MVPIVENADGTFWVDVAETSEVDAVRRTLQDLGLPVTALILDPTCDVVVNEVDWGEAYPKIVPRNGPEPGIIVNPSEIPVDRALLLRVARMSGPGERPETVTVLHLIEGSAPERVARIISRSGPPPVPGLRPAKPPPAI